MPRASSQLSNKTVLSSKLNTRSTNPFIHSTKKLNIIFSSCVIQLRQHGPISDNWWFTLCRKNCLHGLVLQFLYNRRSENWTVKYIIPACEVWTKILLSEIQPIQRYDYRPVPGLHPRVGYYPASTWRLLRRGRYWRWYKGENTSIWCDYVTNIDKKDLIKRS